MKDILVEKKQMVMDNEFSEREQENETKKTWYYYKASRLINLLC